MLRHRLSALLLSFYLLLGGLIAQAAQSPQFLQAPQYCTLPMTGTVCPAANPQALASGDFTGNGILDIAVANSSVNTVSILIGNGAGTFSFKEDYATGTNPQGVAVGDFNGDGNLDLAVTNAGSNTVSIFLGNGDGTFQPKTDYPTGRQPQGVAVGYFSGSTGHLDLAITNATDGTVGVLIGNGDGTFKAMVTYNTGFNPWSVAVGDVNNDGIPDLVVANNNNNDIVSVMLGKGDGTFQNQLQYATGDTPVWVALADLNGDGNLDIVSANQQGNSVSVLLGNGKGSFATHVDYPVGAFPTAVAIADLTGNGNLDLAVSTGNGNTVSVLWGYGDGTFAGPMNIGTGDTPYSVITGNFNNDSNIDLLVANSGGNSVSVILNNGGQNFQARTDYPAGPDPYSVAAADFNGDGFLDLVVANSNCPVFPACGTSSVSIILGNGDGTFQGPIQYSTGTDTDPYSVVVGDFNGDNIPDVAVTDYATNTVSVLLGVGNGTLQGHVDFPVGSEPASVATGDFNGDGNLDLVVANFHDNTISVLLGNGNGTFKPQVVYSVGLGPVSVAVGDFNGDGNLDLVVVNETSNNVSVLLGNGNGTFQPQVTYSTGNGGNPLSVVVGDFSGNGVLDLAVADFLKQQVSVLLGNGNGTFQAVQYYPTGANPSAVVAADFNGDGKLDLALTSTPLGSSPGNLVSLLLGNGDGTFGAPAVFGTGSEAYSAAVGDFNQSGAPDLAVANGVSYTVSVLLNTQGTHISLSSSQNPSAYGQSVTFTATVAASVTGASAPTGTVSLQYGSTVLGSGALVNGVFSASTAALPAGSDVISAVYSGDNNFQPHTVTMTQTVQPGLAGTTTALNASSGLPTLTLTATVTSGPGTPTGTVTFMDGTTQLGSSSLNGSGVATYTTSSLAAGLHNIMAAYGGAGSFAASTSTMVPVTAAFALTDVALSPSSVSPGGSATSTITVTPLNGFNAGLPTFTCAVSGGGTPAPTCSFGTITMSNGVGTATVTVATTPNSRALAAGFTDHRGGLLLAFALLIPAMLLGTGSLSKQHRQRLIAYCFCVLVIGGCLFQAACGGSNAPATTPPPSGGTPAGTYSITVTGSSNSVQNTAPVLTLTVQ